MIYVCDTNILIRFAHRPDPQHLPALSAIRKLKEGGNKNLYPSANMCRILECLYATGFAERIRHYHSADPALSASDRRIFPLLPDNEKVHEKWRELVFDFGVSGKQVHDARITAAMLVHQVTHILTFNTSDFTRYSSMGVVTVDPKTV